METFPDNNLSFEAVAVAVLFSLWTIIKVNHVTYKVMSTDFAVFIYIYT